MKPTILSATLSLALALASSAAFATDVSSGASPSIVAVNKIFSMPADQLMAEPSQMSGFDIVSIKDSADFLLVSNDGAYILFKDDVIDVEQRRSIILDIRDAKDRVIQPVRADIVSELNPDDLIVYSAIGDVKAQITVFSEPTCPYCRKLHEHMTELNKAGIEVRYALFPRGGMDSPVADALAYILSKDPSKQRVLLNNAYRDGDISGLNADSLEPSTLAEARFRLEALFNAGNEAGLKGTPFTVLEDGQKIEGYRPPEAMIELIMDAVESTGPAPE